MIVFFCLQAFGEEFGHADKEMEKHINGTCVDYIPLMNTFCIMMMSRAKMLLDTAKVMPSNYTYIVTELCLHLGTYSAIGARLP